MKLPSNPSAWTSPTDTSLCPSLIVPGQWGKVLRVGFPGGQDIVAQNPLDLLRPPNGFPALGSVGRVWASGELGLQCSPWLDSLPSPGSGSGVAKPRWRRSRQCTPNTTPCSMGPAPSTGRSWTARSCSVSWQAGCGPGHLPCGWNRGCQEDLASVGRRFAGRGDMVATSHASRGCH